MTIEVTQAQTSYAAFQQQRGRLPDLIEAAIEIYAGFMADDDYDAQGCLDKVVAKLRTARDWYPTATQPAAAEDEVERVAVCQRRLDDIRDERHFPAHMLDVHDDMLEICDELAAIASMRPEQQWQPIETAPKDGTRVLLWIEPTRLAMPFAWNGRVWMGDDFPLNMAWATHWMPTPAPPSAACAKQGGE